MLELLKKDVVMTTKYVHSYPYDWRTKKVLRGEGEGGGEERRL